MKPARVIGAMGSVAIMVPMAVIGGAQQASSHGAMEEPRSRSLVCYQEGPENPTSDVCMEVVNVGGSQPLYDWMEVNIPDASGRHRKIIPDGQLCSAGREKYAGLDLARDDWPATSLQPGEHTFRYKATAPHAGGFALYITKDGYDPTQPLAWDDLEAEPFLTADAPVVQDGYYVMPGTIPEKTGRHLIYAIWQRTDSPEAFYACSDVDFGGGSAGGDTGSGDTGSGDGGSGDTGSGGEGCDHMVPPDESATEDPQSGHSLDGSGGPMTDDTEVTASTGASPLQSTLMIITAIMAGLVMVALMRPARAGTHRRLPSHRRNEL